MCGIFGFTLKVDQPEQILREMGDSQRHRGPNGDGYYFDDHIAMGMRRLSILDVAAGNQPFFSEDRSVVAFCNGEIYNFKALKQELSKKGYRFRTQNDVEVLPAMYLEYGPDFVQRLNGMFAIAIYDLNADKLFLYRDHVGIKPLYFAIVGGQIIYSSELKSILRLQKVRKELNYDALSTYLDLMYIPRPMTPFKDVHKLDSGAYLEWHAGRYKIQKYWDPQLLSNGHKSEFDYAEEVHALLEDSVRLQLVSDVPVGSFLSGGVDSSMVTALAAKSTDKPFSVFHIHWKDIAGKLDESSYARQVSDMYDVQKYFHDVSDIDVVHLLPKLIYHLDEPFGDAAFIPTYYLAQIAAEKITVMLNGAGGDELFGGYGHHLNYSPLKSRINQMLHRRAPALSYYDIWRSAFRSQWKRLFPWYVPDTFRSSFERKFQQSRGIDNLNAVMLNDIEYYLQDDILFLSDKMTMAASIECRVPLLDHRLVELTQQIPSSMKIKDGEKKYLLKKVGERLLPREVLYRPKEGFGFPIWKWVNDYKELYFDLLLENGALVRYDLVNVDELRNAFLKNELSQSESWYYWLILVLDIWLQLFVDEKNYADVYDLY